jgi:hypothetical protein
MKSTDNMPETGQFVAVWEHNGNVWSGTYKWKDSELLRYSVYQDRWLPIYLKGERWYSNSQTIFYLMD